jgi:hypothetical protein
LSNKRTPTERLGNEKEFIGLVLTRLPRAYQNCIDDALDGRSSVKLLLKAMETDVKLTDVKLGFGNSKISDSTLIHFLFTAHQTIHVWWSAINAPAFLPGTEVDQGFATLCSAV